MPRPHIPSLFLSLFLGALPLAAQAERGASQAESFSRNYDVGELISEMRVAYAQEDGQCGMFLPRIPALAEALQSRNGNARKNVTYHYPGQALTRDRLIKLLAESRVASRKDLLVWRDTLAFRGTQARQERLRDLLQSLAYALHPRIRVEVSFLRGVALPDRVDLDAKATDALLAAAETRSVHRAQLRGDLCELIRSGSHANLILDWDAEVAQKATVYDPKVIRVELGLQLGLLATVLADGRIEILAGLQQSTPRAKFKARALAGRGQGALHHPRLDTRLLVSRGVIADGGALVFGGPASKHGLCVIRCHMEPRDANLLSGRFQAVGLGDLLHPVPPLRGIEPPPRPGQEAPIDPDSDATDIGDRLRVALGVTENRTSDWEVLGNQLLVLGEAGQDTKTRAVSKRLLGLARKRSATRHALSVELRAGPVAAESVASLQSGGMNLAAFASKVPSLGLVAALPGHPFQHIEGMETTFIRDLDVEIAAKSTAANPYVRAAFSGVSVVGTLRRGLSGGLRIDGSLYHANVQLERVDALEPTARDVDAVSREFVKREIRSVQIKRGRWQLLALQKSPTGDGSIAFMMRVAK